MRTRHRTPHTAGRNVRRRYPHRPLLRSRLAGGAVVLATTSGLVATTGTPASAAVTGLEIVSVASATADSTADKTVIAYCPVGKKVVGAGAKVRGGSGEVQINEIFPRSGSVYVSASEDDNGTTADWRVRAYAVCADAMPDLTIEQADSGSDSDDKQAVATCPDGTEAIGTGASISGSSGLIIDDIARSGAEVTAVGLEDDDGTPAPWTITAYAICAPEPEDFEVTTDYSPFNSVSPKSATAHCPPGTRLIGTSFHTTGGSGEVVVEEIVPETGRLTVTASEDDDGTSNDWEVIAHAHCAKGGYVGSPGGDVDGFSAG